MKPAMLKAALVVMALCVVFAAVEGTNLAEQQGINEATNCEKDLEQGRKKSEPIVDELVKKMPDKAEEIRRHNEALWSRDIEEAKKAIQYFAKLKAGNLLALALKHPCDEVKTQAASSLKGLVDKEFMPDLVVALKRSNVIVIGGTEAQILRNRLKQALVEALAYLTGQDFSEELAYLRAQEKEYLAGDDAEGIEKINAVIAKCEKWLEEQKQKEERMQKK